MKEDMIEREHKELDLIQDCIKRMAHNSFMVKGWTVALVAALIALFTKSGQSAIVLSVALLITAICFWWLDSFYISIEKKYRALYNDVINKRANNDYSNMYNLDISKYKNIGEYKQSKVLLSSTPLCFYGILILMILIYMGYSFCLIIHK